MRGGVVGGLNHTISDELRTHLVQLLDARRSELAGEYQQILRAALFNRRTGIRPSMVSGIASDEVDTFSQFLHQQSPVHALERGAYFYKTGLSEQPLLHLGQVTRQFFVTHLETEQFPPVLAVIDAYQEGAISGYIQSLEKAVFSEQERTRRAFERVMNRD